MVNPGAQLLLMVLPLLVDTADWNPECPLKPTGTSAPANSKVRCTVSGGCKVTCKHGYIFPLGERQIFYKCRDGRWHLEGGDPIYYQECIPFCKPACMNGGHCIAPHTCQCPEGWYGRACRRAVKLVTTSTRPIEYSTNILKHPVEIPDHIPDTTTTTTEPTTTHATTTETTTTALTTSSTSTKRTTTVEQFVYTNSSITTPSPTITQVDSSLDTEIRPPTVPSMSSETVTEDLYEEIYDSSSNDNGQGSADYGYDESLYRVDLEDPASDRLDASDNMDYREDDIDARLQIDASSTGGCYCTIPWLSQTTIIVLLILLLK
ncbi:unnamed protein product [Meganyctiphanes norvegica]|uniref:EGF-like domain-containing protein n=1 Tax=Meganyctiphanes norvegica TaxID=48144 RepID=A0AAV2SFS0_MEGNR